jgi:ribosomal-protein-alanine N-acetyltransferase
MLNFQPFKQKDSTRLYPIYQACNAFAQSEKTFNSSIGGRYFNIQALLNDKPIGFYIGEQVLDEVTLMEIAIAPELQGKGYGKALFNHFLELARHRGAKQCFLEVRASNISAQMLYINAGFIQTGKRTGYYPAEVGYEDAILMSKTF